MPSFSSIVIAGRESAKTWALILKMKIVESESNMFSRTLTWLSIVGQNQFYLH
jgi:hypothetical protein